MRKLASNVSESSQESFLCKAGCVHLCWVVGNTVILLWQGFCMVDVRKHFFSNRIVKVWNSLPATADVFATVRRFKSFIERVDLSEYAVLCSSVSYYCFMLFYVHKFLMYCQYLLLYLF